MNKQRVHGNCNDRIMTQHAILVEDKDDISEMKAIVKNVVSVLNETTEPVRTNLKYAYEEKLEDNM